MLVALGLYYDNGSLIDGLPNMTLTSQYDTLRFRRVDTQWLVI